MNDASTIPPPTTHVVCNTVIAHLALDEADLHARVQELEADYSSYRELAQHAIHALADVTRDRDRQRDDRIVGITENRRLREQITTLQGEITTLRRQLTECQRGKAA